MNRNCQSPAIGAFRTDLSFVSQYNAPGNGQPQTVAAYLAAAGLVCAVKAVKEMGKLVLFNRLGRGIGHCKDNGFSLLLQPHLQPSAGGRIL